MSKSKGVPVRLTFGLLRSRRLMIRCKAPRPLQNRRPVMGADSGRDARTLLTVPVIADFRGKLKSFSELVNRRVDNSVRRHSLLVSLLVPRVAVVWLKIATCLRTIVPKALSILVTLAEAFPRSRPGVLVLTLRDVTS